MTHTLNVTRHDHDGDDVEYEIEGPHDDNCAVWMPCCDDKPDADDMDGGYENREWHDVEHMFIEGTWMSRTSSCGGDEDCDDLHHIARDRGLGSHPVEIDYYGDGSWRGVAVDEATS